MSISDDIINMTERKFDKLRQNNSMPKGTLWDGFAKLFDAGILELDNIAADVSYDDFEDMAHISPLDMLDSPNNPEFLDSIIKNTLAANDMKPTKVEDLMRDKL